jgi:predicted transcriptional regulator
VKLNDSEWQIMQVVWEHAPVSARDVLERVEAETAWAYSTVKTLLARLVEKGALSARKRANTSLYQPLIERADARREAVKSLVDRVFDGAFGSLLQHLVADEKLSKRDREKLSRLLKELDENPNPTRRNGQ